VDTEYVWIVSVETTHVRVFHALLDRAIRYDFQLNGHNCDSFYNRTKMSLTKDSFAFAIENVIGRFSQREDITE